MRRLRFSLRTMAALVTAASLFMGYSQWRRREVLRMCAELETRYGFEVPSAWHDWIWQRKPTVMIVISGAKLGNSWPRDPRATPEMIEASRKEFERLKELGVVEYR